MARTKAQEAAKLAQIAHCMDNWTRNENNCLTKTLIHERTFHEFQVGMIKAKVKELKRRLQHDHHYFVEILQGRDQRIQELEGSWEDMANTLHDTNEENMRLRLKVKKLEEQLLDCTCNE